MDRSTEAAVSIRRIDAIIGELQSIYDELYGLYPQITDRNTTAKKRLDGAYGCIEDAIEDLNHFRRAISG